MAIKRVDPNARFRLICEFDDSLEHETSEERAELEKAGKATRYEKYSESLDEKELKFKEGVKPDYFHIRCLKNAEVAEIQGRHFVVNVQSKTAEPKNAPLMFLEMFNAACVGLEGEDGSTKKITADELGFAVATSIGATIYTFTAMGKHLKK